MGYLPLPGELDPLAAMGWWLDCRQPLAVPCVDWASSTMCAGRLASLDDSLLVNGPHGTREPALVEPVAASAIDVVLVPGLAFDSRGNRMGRGGGFYDRFLATLGPQVQLLGLCVGEQLVDEIPTEPHDRPVDLVIHPAGVIDAR